MAVVSTAHQKQIEAAIAGGKPEAAFAIVEGYADLRHGDMPPLSKGALAAIAKDPTAVRAFVLGTTSTSISVRRFCRKYLPKVGEPAAGPLLALAAESLDPFRPGEGLLGSFGGVVSPIARTILDDKMDFEIRDNHAYSEAGRYGKEVMDDVVFLVGATKHRNLVIFCEYMWGRIEGIKDATRDWPHEDYAPPWTQTTVQQTLGKNAKGWGDAVVRWAAGHTLLLDETPDDPVAIELARRVREGGPKALAELKVTMVIQHARHFYGLGEEHRVALCRNLLAAQSWLPAKLRPYIEREIDDYRKKYPGEADRATTAPESSAAATPAEKVTKASAAANTSTAEPATPQMTPATADDAGPGGESALLAVLRLAFYSGLPRLHAAINRTVDEDLRDGEKPKSGGSAEDERVLAAVHAAILGHRAKRPGARETRRAFGDDNTYVPDHVLEHAAFGAELTEMLIRALDTRPAYILASAAATLLPRAGLDKFGKAWATAPKVDMQYFDDRDVLGALADRRIAPISLLHAVFTREETEFELALNESCHRAISMLYHWAGDPGREAALDLLARYPYPKEVNEYANRRDFSDPHLATMWTAWQRGDAEMLGLAFERFALPYFWKGSKAMLPKREPMFTSSGYAPRSDTGEGVPLADVWALASKAGRVSATVRAALRHAELCEAPRTILELVAPEDFEEMGDDVLAMLESSNAAVLAAGLGVVSRVPGVVRERAEEAVTLAARSLASTRSGAAKEAAVALSALGNAHAGVRSQAYAALADGLAVEAAPVLQAILKSMKTLPGPLPDDARQRIIELTENDPARFEKLAKPLLAA